MHACERRYGTDFSLIAALFPNRNRRQIKNKFKREERDDPRRMDLLLNGGRCREATETVAASLPSSSTERAETSSIATRVPVVASKDGAASAPDPASRDSVGTGSSHAAATARSSRVAAPHELALPAHPTATSRTALSSGQPKPAVAESILQRPTTAPSLVPSTGARASSQAAPDRTELRFTDGSRVTKRVPHLESGPSSTCVSAGITTSSITQSAGSGNPITVDRSPAVASAITATLATASATKPSPPPRKPLLSSMMMMSKKTVIEDEPPEVELPPEPEEWEHEHRGAGHGSDDDDNWDRL